MPSVLFGGIEDQAPLVGRARRGDASDFQSPQLDHGPTSAEAAGWEQGFAFQTTVLARDQRERYMRLTPAGRRTLEQALPLWRQAQAQVVTAIGHDAWHALRGGLQEFDCHARRARGCLRRVPISRLEECAYG